MVLFHRRPGPLPLLPAALLREKEKMAQQAGKIQGGRHEETAAAPALRCRRRQTHRRVAATELKLHAAASPATAAAGGISNFPAEVIPARIAAAAAAEAEVVAAAVAAASRRRVLPGTRLCAAVEAAAALPAVAQHIRLFLLLHVQDCLLAAAAETVAAVPVAAAASAAELSSMLLL